MATATSISLDHSWVSTGSRRNSTESVLSIQGRETDYVRDTTDTEYQSEGGLEYEPVSQSEPEDAPVTDDSSGESDKDIIKTRIIEVRVRDDGDLVLADSEQTDSHSDDSDSEIDLHDYWRCAQCANRNNNPLYRYCEKCFKVRKNFFPPRPKRKSNCKLQKAKTDPEFTLPTIVHQLCEPTDSGIDSAFTSQEFSQASQVETKTVVSEPNIVDRSYLKRRAGSVDRNTKRSKLDSDSDATDIENESRLRKSKSVDKDVAPLVKTVSDPSLTIDDLVKDNDNMCMMCFSEPKSGVFVHGRIAHICCCYKCAVKVWSKAKRCPICNSKVSNVLKAVVM